MMRTAVTCLVAVYFLFGGCLRRPCPECVSEMHIPDFSDQLDNGEQLREAFVQLLHALSVCEFSEDLRGRIPYLPSELIVADTGRLAECRCLEVVHADPQSRSLISFELVPVSSCDGPLDRRYVIFANLVHDRWLFSWPEELGVPLH